MKPLFKIERKYVLFATMDGQTKTMMMADKAEDCHKYARSTDSWPSYMWHSIFNGFTG